MATALPPNKLFNLLGGFVENFVTFGTNFHILRRDCAQTITPSLSKFPTQSANLLPFKKTYAPWPQLYLPKNY